MNNKNKKLTALLGSLLLLAAAMPMATAHLTNPAGSDSSAIHTIRNGDLDGDAYRWTGSSPSSSPGVSGSYDNLAPPNLYLASTAQDTNGSQIFPNGFIAFGLALCDLEVLGDGGSHDPLDETTVDDDGPAGLVPDGTFDDGGFGGGCHTNGHYADPAYNTPGCGENIHFDHAGNEIARTSTPFAHAEDLVSDGDVWISASCDWEETQGSGFSLSGCVVNEIISGASVPVLVDCVDKFLNGAPAPFLACGGDSSADGGNYGPGGGSGGAGIPYPPITNGCQQEHASAVIFVFNYVDLDTLDVVPATVGWVDSRDLTSYTPECSDGVDNDGDGDIDDKDEHCRFTVDILGVTIIDQYNPADDDESS